MTRGTQAVTQVVKKVLTRFGFEIRRVPKKQKLGPLPLWERDDRFAQLYESIAGVTLVDRRRCYMLYELALHAASLPGEAAEVGVYKGGTAKLLATVFAEHGKAVHLFDTFSGMPPSDPARDLHKEGDFGDTSFEEVRKLLADFSRDVALHPGFFPDTAQGLDATSFCFVHVDVDIYSSVLDCCTWFHDRLVWGGVMVFDDYGFPTCPGAKAAVDEFFFDKPERPIYLPTGQCVVIKQ